eukprot:TRINITY_DN13334_c0_g1_i1.p1 TRINITY_DN13334_c0_g1~~TRINITY_DN13334_c0_g1_i1.p1  ORF type:complete len:116 (-),score=10.47 TRINITY_DN13334_c0_g1_i1:786-1133(-)
MEGQAQQFAEEEICRLGIKLLNNQHTFKSFHCFRMIPHIGEQHRLCYSFGRRKCHGDYGQSHIQSECPPQSWIIVAPGYESPSGRIHGVSRIATAEVKDRLGVCQATRLETLHNS